MILEQEGYSVTSASDGQEALSKMKDGPLPALILLDQHMPNMGAEAFLTKRLGLEPLKSIPVILMSASPPATPLAKKERFLLKPFQAEEVLGLIREVACA